MASITVLASKTIKNLRNSTVVPPMLENFDHRLNAGAVYGEKSDTLPAICSLSTSILIRIG